MASRTAPPDLPGSQVTESPLDRALTLMLAGERESALRWAAAAIKHDASVASALILTSRLLGDSARTDAAIEATTLGLARAIDAGNLPLAVAAIGDLRQLGADVSARLDSIADVFCAGSSRLDSADKPPPPLPVAENFQPLSSHLTGPALLSKATELVREASEAYAELSRGDVPPMVAPTPLFSELSRDDLRQLIECFEMLTVPTGKHVVREGDEGTETFIVARGELEVRKSVESGGITSEVTLARLTNGALFGEMALLSRAPRAASVTACRPSILLVARKEALEQAAAIRPKIGAVLAAYCKRRMVHNLIRTAPLLLALPPGERTKLVERLETTIFERGDKLVVTGSEPKGLHLIASGQVSVVGQDDSGETFVISTLGPGEVVGEVALVLRRKANADVVCVHPTVTLHLRAEEFIGLVRAHPAILAGLYLLAVEREEETRDVLGSSTTSVLESHEFVLV